MMPAFLFELLLKSTLILSGVFALTLACRKASAALRHLLWSLAFGALMLLPVLDKALPSLQVRTEGLMPWVQSQAAGAISTQAASAEPPADLVPLVRAATSPLERNLGVLRAVDSPAPFLREAWTLSDDLWLAYAMGVLICAAPLVLAAISLAKLERSATRIASPTWLTLLENVAGRYRLRQSVTLLESPGGRVVPMTWGILRARVLLPADAQQWPEERRRLVLLHELAHVKRGDAVIQLAAALVAVMYWWHPLVWMARKRLQAEAESACDDLVVSAGEIPSHYAELLFGVASKSCGRSGYAAIAMARGSGAQLRSRIRSILDERRTRQALSSPKALCVAMVLGAFLVPLTMLHAADAPAATATAPLNSDFPKLLHWELGDAQFFKGDEITISDVCGTQDTFAIGGTYEIKGRYTLSSAKRAMLAAYLTAADAKDGYGESDRGQTMTVDAGTGEFTLRMPVKIRGFPHVSFYAGGACIGGVYFGIGESVLKTQKGTRSNAVLILVGPDSVYFEGAKTTWDALPALLEKVPDRPHTVLAFALTDDQMTVAKYHEALARVSALAERLHFRYASDTGIQHLPEAPSPGGPGARAEADRAVVVAAAGTASDMVAILPYSTVSLDQITNSFAPLYGGSAGTLIPADVRHQLVRAVYHEISFPLTLDGSYLLYGERAGHLFWYGTPLPDDFVTSQHVIDQARLNTVQVARYAFADVPFRAYRESFSKAFPTLVGNVPAGMSKGGSDEVLIVCVCRAQEMVEEDGKRNLGGRVQLVKSYFVLSPDGRVFLNVETQTTPADVPTITVPEFLHSVNK